MLYKEFLEATQENEEEYELPELLYFGALERLEDVQKDLSKLEDIKHVRRVIRLFLISWGMMTRVVGRENLDWKRLGDTLRNLEKDFAALRSKSFLSANLFSDETTSNAVKKIYSELDPIPYLGSPTTISKILHLLNPEIFLMWDNAIVNYYHKENRKINYSADGYLEFLKENQETILSALSEFGRDTGKPLSIIEKEIRIRHHNRTMAKIIDEYNWMIAHR